MFSRWILKVLAVCACQVLLASSALAAIQTPRVETLGEELRGGFYARINALAFGVYQRPKPDSDLNPNNILNIPRYQAVFNPRPDFNLSFRQWQLGVKPRFILSFEQFEDGQRDGDESTTTALYINEWLARYRLSNELFVSYGRENLQWGPAVLLSPSNPFFPDNGKINPAIELPGFGYGRLVWIPSSTWSLSFIANTNEGSFEQGQVVTRLVLGRLAFPGAFEFERAYALKLDYTGEGRYFSLIPAYRENDEFQVGFFGGWNVSDALLLYGEGNVPGDTGDFELLAGFSYTLEAGPTIGGEYYLNNNGCDLEPFALCFSPDRVNPSAVPTSLGRRNYLMVQYTDTKVWRDLNLSLRFIHDLDDSSSRVLGIFAYEAGEHMELYLTANAFTGSSDTEFGSLIEYSFFTGAAYTF